LQIAQPKQFSTVASPAKSATRDANAPSNHITLSGAVIVPLEVGYVHGKTPDNYPGTYKISLLRQLDGLELARSVSLTHPSAPPIPKPYPRK
jgi:hypothetical protein